ncbi:MAG TPA: O-antigen ligase family protein [Bacteroidota bacterium]|nr:O-antigen ligase family protein [Bacteroidota bacterium]
MTAAARARERALAASSATLRWAMYLFLASACVSIAVNSLALGLMALSWGVLMLLGRRWEPVATPLDWFFLAYVAAELCATAFSVHPWESLVLARRVLLIGIVYCIASRVDTRAEAQRVTGILLGAAVIVALIGVAKLMLGGPGDNTRLGIFQFYMTTSQLMMIVLLLLVPFGLHPLAPRPVRIAALAAAIPVAVSLYATVTRGAYLAAAAGLLLIALVRSWKLVFPLIVIILCVILFAPPYVTDRLHSIVDIHHPENASRILLWSTGLKIFQDHPVTGVGDIDLGELLRQYAPPGYSGQWGHLHNVAMHVLVTLGVAGLTAVTALFIRIGVVEWRIYRAVRDDWFRGSLALGAFAAFIGFQVNGLTEWSFGNQTVVVLVWVTVGLALALDRMGAGETA